MPAIDPVRDAHAREYIAAQRGSDYQEYLAAIDARFAAGRARRMAAAEGAVCFARASHQELSALAQLQFLPWDTECLGFGVCRIAHLLGRDALAKSAVLEEALAEARRRGQHLVTARVAGDDFTSLHALENEGFRVVDAMNVFLWDSRRGLPDATCGGAAEEPVREPGLPLPFPGHRHHRGPDPRGADSADPSSHGRHAAHEVHPRNPTGAGKVDPNPHQQQAAHHVQQRNAAGAGKVDPCAGANLGHCGGIEVAPLQSRAGLLDGVRELAPRAFACSRLNNDPGFSPEQVRRFYGRLFDSLTDHPAAVKLAACLDSRVAGFVVGKIDEHASRDMTEPIGCLELIAVHPDLAGRGVGGALVRAFFHELERQARYIEVATQTHNYPALNLYAGMGLKLISSLTTLHAWIDNSDTGP